METLHSLGSSCHPNPFPRFIILSLFLDVGQILQIPRLIKVRLTVLLKRINELVDESKVSQIFFLCLKSPWLVTPKICLTSQSKASLETSSLLKPKLWKLYLTCTTCSISGVQVISNVDLLKYSESIIFILFYFMPIDESSMSLSP